MSDESSETRAEARPATAETHHATQRAARRWIARPFRLVEKGMEGGADLLWVALRRHPYLGVTVALGGGIAVGIAVGAGEVALGIACGAAAYLMLKKRVPPSQALDEVLGASDRLRE